MDTQRIDRLIAKHSKHHHSIKQHVRGLALASPLGKKLWPEEHRIFIQLLSRLRSPPAGDVPV